MYTLSGNFGLPLGESGFLNLTGDTATPIRPIAVFNATTPKG